MTLKRPKEKVLKKSDLKKDAQDVLAESIGVVPFSENVEREPGSVSHSSEPFVPRSPLAMLGGVLACFQTLQLAIILLSLMALGVLIGVVLPQEGLVELAEIKAQYGENFRMMKALGAFNVYSSYWFLTLEAMFFFNLLFGSFKWLRPAFLSAVRRDFCDSSHIKASKNHFWFPVSKTLMSKPETVVEVTRLLKKQRYHVWEKTAQAKRGEIVKLYAAKGNFSRLGPAVAHFGILCLLLASVYGVFTGFTAQKLAVPGDTFEISEAGLDMFKPRLEAPFWQGAVPSYKVMIHDFKINFYESDPGTVQQYLADIELKTVDGKSIERKTISVNTPLSQGDFTIYQASYSPTGNLFMTLNGVPKMISVNTEMQGQPVSFVDVSKPGESKALVVFPFLQGQSKGATENYVRVFLHTDGRFLGASKKGDPAKMPKNLKLSEGQSGTIGGMKVGFVKPEIATGLQIKQAPETFWIYLAFGLIMLGTVMCVFSQRQIWVSIEPEKVEPEADADLAEATNNVVYLNYKTNKSKLSFEKEIVTLKAALFNRFLTPGAASSVQGAEASQSVKGHDV